jgi:Protein of unknown function (DUF2723)
MTSRRAVAPASERRKPADRSARAAPPVPLAWSIALAAAMFIAYLALAPRVTADEDAAEITLALATGGVIHPPGYPVYTLLGHGWMAALRALGVGYALAANAWSALGAAIALCFLHRLALALLPRDSGLSRMQRFAVAALPVVALGLNPQWTAEATIVEVNSWLLAWLAGAAVWVVMTMRALGGRPAPDARLPFVWGLICGLGAAHHSTSVFWSAAFTVALVWALVRARAWRAWMPLPWLAGAVIALSSDAWVYLRAAHPDTASIWPTLEPTLGGAFRHLTGALYHGYLGRWNPDAREAADLARDVYPWLWPALAASAVWLALAKTAADRLARGALLAGSALELTFVYRYGVPDPVAYFLPPLAIALLVLAGAGHAVAARLARAPAAPRAAVAAVVVLALAVDAWAGVRAAAERRRDLADYDHAIRDMWHAIPYPRCIFLWPADPYYKVELYRRLEHDRPDIAVYNPEMLCNEYPARRFRERWGFDPLANNGLDHAREPIPPRFIVAGLTAWDPRYVGRLCETIADSARVPVVLFDGHAMELRRLSGVRGTP